MVLDGKIVITGLDLGNVRVMVQPKRGCHKAKCTGEVCKILHDPVCPPPHQYLATYRYIQECFHADACIHVGTDGSLEYLPGKVTGMSDHCWPDIVLGELPNFYLYHTGVPSEGASFPQNGGATPISLIISRSPIRAFQINFQSCTWTLGHISRL